GAGSRHRPRRVGEIQGMNGTLGTLDVTLGDANLGELRETKRDDRDAVLAGLIAEGYVLIRGFHERALVEAARVELCGDTIDPATGHLLDGKAIEYATYVSGLESPAYHEVVAGPRVMRFFDDLLGEKAITYDFKWLRYTGQRGATGPHCDMVFMGRGTD